MTTSVSPSRREFRLGDSPWFWLALFGTVAVAGLLAVNQKYARRQMRLELKLEHRVQAQQERARRTSPIDSDAVPGERFETPIDSRRPDPRASLVPLLGLFSAMAIVGYLGLALARRRHLAGLDEPAEDSP